MKGRKKILFLQEFSMERKGGGVAIIKRLMMAADSFNYEAKVAYDRTANKGLPAEMDGQASFYTLPRNMRLGIGRLIATLTILSLDFFSFVSLVRLIKREDPDVVHITAHGVCFPIMVKAARFANKEIVVSVHDLWFFSVRGYISSRVAERLFRKSITAVNTLYVISPEMRDFLSEKYGKKNYQVVHDGILTPPEINYPKPVINHISIFYVGLLHAMQLITFNMLVEALGSILSHSFTIGICSGTEYMPDKIYNNITITNYGWVAEARVKEISKDYSYGLLPLSFDPDDELFYRTSLMTKIPFYTSVLLPIICIGPASASAVRLVEEEEIGMVCDSGRYDDILLMLKEIVQLTPETYAHYRNNLKQSAATTFNLELITGRFYHNLFPAVQ